LVLGDQNAEHRDRMVEAWRRNKRCGDGFVGLTGHSANQEAPEVISRGS